MKALEGPSLVGELLDPREEAVQRDNFACSGLDQFSDNDCLRQHPHDHIYTSIGWRNHLDSISDNGSTVDLRDRESLWEEHGLGKEWHELMELQQDA